MKANIIVRVMKLGVDLPIIRGELEVIEESKHEFKKSLHHIKKDYNKKYPKLKTYFTIEIIEE